MLSLIFWAWNSPKLAHGQVYHSCLPLRVSCNNKCHIFNSVWWVQINLSGTLSNKSEDLWFVYFIYLYKYILYIANSAIRAKVIKTKWENQQEIVKINISKDLYQFPVSCWFGMSGMEFLMKYMLGLHVGTPEKSDPYNFWLLAEHFCVFIIKKYIFQIGCQKC